MIGYRLIDYKTIIHDPNPEEDYIGDAFRINDLEEKLFEETGGAYKLSKTKLRWYHNLAIVDRPTKEGLYAIYPFHTFYDLIAIQALLDRFHLSIKEIQKLRKKHSHIYSTALGLQKIEHQYKLRSSAPLLVEFTQLGNDPTKGPDDVVQVYYKDLKIFESELSQLPGKWVAIDNQIIPKIRKEFFSMVHKGSHPLHIGIEYVEK